MRYYSTPPTESLKNFVRCFWVLESNQPSYTHRSMADVSVEMVFHYKGQFSELVNDSVEKASLTGVQGPSNKIRRFRIEEQFGIFGVYLFPYALPLLFNIPASELTNQMPDLATGFGREGTEIEERIMLAANTLDRVKIMTEFLERKLQKSREKVHPVLSSIRDIMTAGVTDDIEAFCGKFYLSQRQFERKFKQYSGFTPKLFSRIVRFHAACNHFGNDRKSLTEIAHECGYYDQSHFIHDFKEFSGYCPKTYFKAESEGTEWRSK